MTTHTLTLVQAAREVSRNWFMGRDVSAAMYALADALAAHDRRSDVMAEQRKARKISVSLSPEGLELLEDLCRGRFGGKRSPAVEAAVYIAAAVYGDIATFNIADPLEALQAYTDAQRLAKD